MRKPRDVPARDVILGILLATAAAGGLVGHSLYLGQCFFQDEGPILQNVLTFVGNKTLLPAHTSYPTFYSYLITPLVVAGAMVQWGLDGGDASPVETVARLYLTRPHLLAFPARLLSLVAVCLTLLLLCRALQSQFRPFARWSVVVLGLASPALMEYGAYALPDTTVMLLSAAALLAGWRSAHAARQFAWVVASALFAGLALSSKYTGAPVLVIMAVAIVLHSQQNGASIRRGLRQLALCLVVGAIGFLLGSPGWLLATAAFWRGLQFETKHVLNGHLGADGVPLLGQLELLLTGAPWLTLLAAVGFVLWLRRRTAEGWLPVALIGANLGLSIVVSKQSLHYLFPLFPALLYFASACIDSIAGHWHRCRIAVSIGVLLVSTHAWITALPQGRRESLKLAREYLYSQVPPGEIVAVDWAYVPKLYSELELRKLSDGSLGTRAPAVILQMRHSNPTYEVVPIEYSASFLERTRATHLVTSPDCYDRFFRFGVFTRRPPAPGEPMREDFEERRGFYTALLASPGWVEVLYVDTGNGPGVRVFFRKDVQQVLR